MQGSQREVVERAGSGWGQITSSKPEAVRMLGGFSVSVGSRILEESCWRLKKAAGLVKLLALSPSLTLGCGSRGNNITSDNVSPLHLLDIKRVAFETQPIEAAVPALTGTAWEPRMVA